MLRSTFRLSEGLRKSVRFVKKTDLSCTSRTKRHYATHGHPQSQPSGQERGKYIAIAALLTSVPAIYLLTKPSPNSSTDAPIEKPSSKSAASPIIAATALSSPVLANSLPQVQEEATAIPGEPVPDEPLADTDENDNSASESHAASSSHALSQIPALVEDAAEITALPNASPIVSNTPLSAKYVLVGGGTACYSAMKAILSQDPNADILLISEENEPPYMRPPLSKELWHSDDLNVGQTLRYQDWQGQSRRIYYEPTSFFTDIQSQRVPSSELASIQLQSHQRVRWLHGHRAVHLNTDGKTLTLDNHQQITFDKLLIATGGSPRNLPWMKNKQIQPHISTYRTVADFSRLESRIFSEDKSDKNRKKVIAVVGGGFLGSELACSLAHRTNSLLAADNNVEIVQIYPEDGNMGLVFPQYLSQWTKNQLTRLGIRIYSNALVEKVEPRVGHNSIGDDHSLLTLHLNDGRQVHADHVVVCVGIVPNTALAESSHDLEVDVNNTVGGGIIANSELQARSDIYVAGDVCNYHDVVLGRRRVEHYDHAVLTGRVAGENMSSSSMPKVYRHQSMFWSDLGPKIGYEAVGLLDARLPTVGIWASKSKVSAKSDGRKNKDEPAGVSQDNIRTTLSNTDATQVDSGDGSNTLDDNNYNDVAQSEERMDSPKDYGKGVVYYMKDERVVGVLLWNIFDQVGTARKLLKEAAKIEDIRRLANVIPVYEEKVEE